MKLLKELVESITTDLNEGVMKLALYDALHEAVKQAFDKTLSVEKIVKNIQSILVKNKDLKLTKDSVSTPDMMSMIHDHIDQMIDSILAAKAWTAAAKTKNAEEIHGDVAKEVQKLAAFKHIKADELEYKIKAAIKNMKSDKRLPIRESEGIDHLYQILQSVRKEFKDLVSSGAIAQDNWPTYEMIFRNFFNALRKGDVEEFKNLYHEYAKSRPDSFDMIMDRVYNELGVKDFEQFEKKALKEGKNPTFKVDEFQVTLDDGEWVVIQDGESSVRLTVPVAIWKKIAKISLEQFS